jgi:hypothetical protein
VRRCKYRAPRIGIQEKGIGPINPNSKVKGNRNPKTWVPDFRRPPLNIEGRDSVGPPFDENTYPIEEISESPLQYIEDDENPHLEHPDPDVEIIELSNPAVNDELSRSSGNPKHIPRVEDGKMQGRNYSRTL